MFLSKGRKGIYYLYYINPLTGKRTKVSTHSKLKSEATEFLRRFKPRSAQDEFEKKSKPITLSELRTVVLEYVKVNYEPKTVEMYISTFKDAIKFFGDRIVDTLTYSDLERFKADRSTKLSKTSVNMLLRTIKAACYTGIRYGLIEKNPMKGVKQFTIPQKERLSLNSFEVSLVLKTIDMPLIRNVILFALYTGCRLSEIVNMQYGDIDLDEKLIIIKNKPTFKTKTGKIRRIPICEELFKLLKEICIREDRILGMDEYLFTMTTSVPIAKDYASRMFKKYLRKCGLAERFHFHSLRHTFITNLIKKGVNINFVKELAGHTDIQTTMNYIHIGVEDLRNAVETIKIVA